MERIQQAQACDHRRTNVFMFAFRVQIVINNVTWTLNAIQSKLQIQTPYMTEQRTRFATSLRVLSNGQLPGTLIPNLEFKKMLSKLKLRGKQLSIRPKDSSLYFSFPLVRNVYVKEEGLLINMMTPVYNREPIHNA